MGIPGLLVALFLPWILGVVWLRVRWLKADGIAWPALLGYGYLVGALATTLVMRLLDLMGIRLGFFPVALVLILLIALGLWGGRSLPWRELRIGSDWRDLPGWRKTLFAALLGVVAFRLAGLCLEIIWQPLFAWDAWARWATKARVWYELGQLAPFVHANEWLTKAVAGAYTDSGPGYPPVIPLLQTWSSYGLGRWDDALMNLPWLQCVIALCLAFYGQARLWQLPPLFALTFTYFLLSLPILDTHVALAGYADLFMGAAYGLAAMAFFHWSRTRDRWQGAMALLFGLGCILIKQPGVAWALTFIPALMVALLPRTGLRAVAVLAGAGVVTLFVLEGRSFVFLGNSLNLNFKADWDPFLQNLLLLDNWHLLWYLVIGALALSFQKLFTPLFRSMTVLMLAAFSFLAIVFFFTQAQAFAEDYTTINRAILHMAPMLLFYIMTILWEASSRHAIPPAAVLAVQERSHNQGSRH